MKKLLQKENNIPDNFTGIVEYQFNANCINFCIINGISNKCIGPNYIDYSHKEYWIEGKWSRTDGPAIEWSDGRKDYYVNDKLVKTTFLHGI